MKNRELPSSYNPGSEQNTVYGDFPIPRDFSAGSDPEQFAQLSQTGLLRLFSNRFGIGVALFLAIGAGVILSTESSSMQDYSDKALEIQRAKVEGRLWLPPQYEEIQISQVPLVTVSKELGPTSADKLKFFQALIEEKSLNMDELSFREMMAQLGVVMGPVEQFGRTFALQSGGEGVKIRRLPLPDEWDKRPPYGQIVVDYLNWGEDLPTYGFIESLDQKTGKRLIFGITDWDVSLAPEANTAPNKFGNKLYRLGSYLFAWPNANGTVDYSVVDPDPVLRQFAESKLQSKVSINLSLVQK